MSYDYMFFKLRSGVVSHEDICEETTLVIGSSAEIWARLASIFPNAKWDSRGWGYLDAESFSGEVSFADSTGKSFSVGNLSVERVHIICNEMGVTAFDGQKLLLITPVP